MNFSPSKAAKIFVLSCMLHNILQQNGEDEDHIDFNSELGTDTTSNSNANKDGEKKRKILTSFLH